MAILQSVKSRLINGAQPFSTGRSSAGRSDHDLSWMSLGPFVRLRRARGVGYAVPGFSRDCLIRLIDFPEMPIRNRAHPTIKQGRSAHLVRAKLPVRGYMMPVAYKRVRRCSFFKRLTALPRTNRTLRAWRMGHVLRGRGISTALPLAVVIPRRFDLSRPSFLVTEWIEGSLNLEAYYQHLERLNPAQRLHRLKQAAASLGRLLGHMHAQHVSHRDLKSGNLLLVEDGGDIKSYVIDLDGAEVRRRLPERRRIRDLARLVLELDLYPDVGRTACLGFLRTYLESANQPALGWKALWQSIRRRSVSLGQSKRRKRARSTGGGA